MHRRPALTLGIASALVVVLLGAFAAAIVETHSQARQDVETRFNNRTVRIADSVEALLASSFAASREVFAKRYGGKIDQAELDRQVRESNIPYLAILDAEGRVITTSAGTPKTALDRMSARPPEVQAIQRGAGFYASDVDTKAVPGTPLVNISFGFGEGANRRMLIQGTPVALMNIYMAEFLKTGPNPEKATSVGVDGRGDIIGGPGIKQPGMPVDPDLRAAFLRRPQGPYGDRYFTTASIGGTTWKVILSAEQRHLYASVNGARRSLPWVLWAAFALTAMAALVLVRRAIAGTRRIEAANDELGQLNSALASSYERLNERATALQRSNEELEQFASIASHDLTEPLRKVQAFGEQLQLRYGDMLPPDGIEYLERMRGASHRMQSLIDDLLQFALITTKGSAFRPVALDDVVRDVIDDLEVTIEEAGARVEVSPLPEVEADPVQMRQLVQNLISNAVKFRRVGVHPEVYISGETVGDKVTLRVGDNGIGFDARYGERIFGVFKRLHGRDAYPGTGIGLALCRKIAERHGGTITARGVPGEGATFTVTLPASQRGFPSTNGAPRASEPAVV